MLFMLQSIEYDIYINEELFKYSGKYLNFFKIFQNANF